MRKLVSWLADREKREIASFLGGALAVVTGAVWTVYVHFSPAPQQSSPQPDPLAVAPAHPSPEAVPEPYGKSAAPTTVSIVAKFTVCEAGKPEECPKGITFAYCDSAAKVARDRCMGLQTQILELEANSGGRCGVTLMEVTCQASSR
jgi:hypothetical protein